MSGDRSGAAGGFFLLWLLLEYVLQWLQVRPQQGGQKIQTQGHNKGSVL